jgi:hypothetical protein
LRKRAINLKLKAAIAETGKPMSQVMKESSIKGPTLWRKINGFADFTENDIEILSKIVNKPVMDIFFINNAVNAETK